MMRRSAGLLAVALAAGVASAAPAFDSSGYRHARAPRAFAFPRDHGSHPEFRTEWWYYTGRLVGADRAYGFQLTFFRVGVTRAWDESPSAWAPRALLFAHFALTDVEAGTFAFAERAARPALGLAGADTSDLHVWIGDWSVRRAADGTHRLAARDGRRTLALTLAPAKPPVLHGRDGVSRKAADATVASHYVSLTRLAASGTLELDGRAVPVAGEAWMDHEFGSGALAADHVGWDWFSVQLDDGRELMLYALRRRDGTIDPFSSGTLIEADGSARHLPRDAFAIAAAGTWRSPRGGRYPARWTLSVPSAGLSLDVRPEVADQELETPGSTGVTYWEGLVRVTGTAVGRPVTGHGYVELTGYSGDSPGVPPAR